MLKISLVKIYLMAEIAMVPIFVAVSAADAAALNIAVGTAVTTARAVSGYVPNSVEVSPTVTATTNTQDVLLLVTSIRYKVQTQP